MSGISIVDPICKNNEHYIFNLSLLANFANSKNEKKINFYCYESNSHIIDDFSETDVNFYLNRDFKSYFKRVFVFFYKVFYSIKIIKSKRIVLFAIDNTLIPLLFIVNFILCPFFYKKMIIISHNNLYTLKNSYFKKVLFKFFLKLYQPKLVFLSPCFANEFVEKINYKNVVGFYHQNFQNVIFNIKKFDLIKSNNITNEQKTKNILISKSYTSYFLNLFNENNDKIYINNSGNKLIINYVSDYDIDFNQHKSVSFKRIDVPKDMKAYFNLIYNTDFVFLPENYIANHRASGVLMDSLSLKTNFIAPNVSHFKDIYIKYGIGCIYNNTEEFFAIINEILNDKISSEINEIDFKTLIKETEPSILANFLLN